MWCQKRRYRQTDGRKRHGRTDRRVQTDDGQRDPYVVLCFADSTIKNTFYQCIKRFPTQHIDIEKIFLIPYIYKAVDTD